jgi:tetratricopeptide (TPR) repeat protein
VAPTPLPPAPPPRATAGEASDAAKQATSLLDAKKYWEAAVLFHQVVNGQTGDDEGNKQIAQYGLAQALYNLNLFQVSYAIFADITQRPNHLRFDQSLFWIAQLSTKLPEPADVVDLVGRYNEAQLAQFNTPKDREIFWRLNYLLGRHRYRAEQYDAALVLFAKVNRQSPYYISAQFFSGISSIQIRQSKPAVEAFIRVLGAIDEGVKGVEDETRMRDLAYLSMARTFYSASVKLDEATNSPTVDQTRLSAAVKYWNKVDVASEYWLDALFEESWAYFMAGDYSHALGNIHTIQSPYFPNSYYPEADVLKAYIYYANCQYNDATIIVAQFRAKFDPIHDELTRILEEKDKEPNKEEAFFRFLMEVRDGKARLNTRIKPVVENALSDRQLLRGIEYVKVLDEERGRASKAPASFSTASVGDFVRDKLTDARAHAVNQAGGLARGRYQRNLTELKEQIRQAKKIEIDVTAALRGQVEAAAAGAQVTAKESEGNVVKPDQEHVIWPFNGEYWRDELGFYRQTIRSKCGR